MISRNYARFWAQLLDRLEGEFPDRHIGAPHRNDLPLFCPLPQARIKCNFPKEGLRVELLLGSTDHEVNARRLRVLEQHLPELQRRLGPAPKLRAEPLPAKVQARVAAYRSGTISEERRWPEFQDWFVDVVRRLDAAIHGVAALNTDWPA